MAVTDKTSLIEYIKRQLGAPVLQIEIDDEQINDVIDDAFDLFREYHTDALKLKWKFLDITTDVKEYDLDSDVFAIVDIYGRTSQALATFDNEDQGYLLKGAYVGNTGLFSDEYSAVDVEVIRQRYELYRSQTARDYVFDYSYLERKLTIIGTIEYNETVGILAQCFLDDEDKNYSSLWFRKYCVAKTGVLLGQNRGKYTNVSLPGGAQYNFDDILSRYSEMVDKLEEEIIDRYSDSFFVDMG